jgi:hypothetical protein
MTPDQAPPQAARSALDAEHGRQADQREKGPCGSVLVTHPSVPSPVGRTACRAQESRVPVIGKVASNYIFKTPTPQSLLTTSVNYFLP